MMAAGMVRMRPASSEAARGQPRPKCTAGKTLGHCGSWERTCQFSFNVRGLTLALLRESARLLQYMRAGEHAMPIQRVCMHGTTGDGERIYLLRSKLLRPLIHTSVQGVNDLYRAFPRFHDRDYRPSHRGFEADRKSPRGATALSIY